MMQHEEPFELPLAQFQNDPVWNGSKSPDRHYSSRQNDSEGGYGAQSQVSGQNVSASEGDRQWMEQSLRESQTRLNLIKSIATGIRAGMSVEQAIARTLEQLSHAFPDFRVAYCTISPPGYLAIAHSIEPPRMIPLTGLECDLTVAPEYLAALRTFECVVVSDVIRDRRLGLLAGKIQAAGTQAFVDVPLQQSDQLVGLLCFDCASPRQWSAHEIITLQEVAEYLGVAIKDAEAQRALKASEERWQLALQGSNDGIWDWNVLTNEVFFSPRWKEMLGYEDREIANHIDEWAKRVHPDDIGWVTQAVQDHFAKKTPFYITEHRMLHKDGSYRWILDRGQALWNESGEVVRAVGAHTDVTERKQLEAALQRANQELEQRVAERTEQLQSAYRALAERETLYRTLAQHIPNGAVALFDRNLRYQLCEGIELKTVGLDAGAIIDKSIWEVFPIDVCQQIEPIYRGALSGQATVKEVVLKDQIYETHIVPVRNEGGEIFAGMMLMQNITARKQAEAALRESQAQLQQQLSEIESIYQSAPIGLSVIDLDLRFVRINERLAEINGFSVEAHIGRTVRELLPHLADQAEPMLQRVLAGEPLLNVEIKGETPAQPGVERTWLEHFLPLKIGDQIIGISIVCEEITERKHVEAEREQLLQLEQAARAEAERANRIKDEFLAILSHELRSPLNPILGWSRLLQTQRLSEEKTANALATIERNARLQAQLIEDLLDVSRILRGKLVLNVAPVDLASAIAGAIETVQLAAQAKGIQIQTVLDPNVGPVSGDVGRLQQVVWNLLSNAVKFTPAGGSVQVRLEQVSDRAQIQVSDTGKGISPDFLPYVFEHFRQEEGGTTRQFGGLGLGLAIAKQLIELHGGIITAESQGEDRGATFTVTLPLIEEKIGNRMDTPDGYASIPVNAAPLAGLTILVVEDDTDSRDFITFILEEDGAQVIAVSSALEALRAIAQTKPDVLISDIGMPEMDGYRLIEQIRRLPPEQGGTIPAIALTAYAGETNQRQALSAGYQWHLAKPIEPSNLIAIVAQLVKQNQGVGCGV